MPNDEEHLRLLSIFHYVVGGLAGLFALFPIFYLLLGLLFVSSPEIFSGEGAPPPAMLGWIFVIMGVLAIVVGLIFALLIIICGHFLAKRKHRLFCLVMAGVECIFVPFGTVLGAFTIVVLMRESAQMLFADGRA